MEMKSVFFLALFTCSGFVDSDVKSRYFTRYQYKRLESATKVMTSSTSVDCAVSCLETGGCYAVNYKNQTNENCELTSGLDDVTEMVDDVTSDLFIMDYNTCVEEPGFCTSGATCERTWTSARCHCADPDTFGNLCNTQFFLSSRQDCNAGQNLHELTHDADACKMWCANNAICRAFTVSAGKCFFKSVTCSSNQFLNFYTDLYHKVTLNTA